MFCRAVIRRGGDAVGNRHRVPPHQAEARRRKSINFIYRVKPIHLQCMTVYSPAKVIPRGMKSSPLSYMLTYMCSVSAPLTYE